VFIQAAYTNVTLGFMVNFTAAIDGRATANRWEFGDGTVLTNRPYASHGWATAGDYLVVLQAYNDTYPDGVSAMVRVHVLPQPVHYVALGSTNPLEPFTSWATAANNIQDAVDAASVAGALVLVTNGVYETGGRMLSEGGTMNRVAVTKALMVRSVNGAAVTVIKGYHDPDPADDDHSAVRCVYLASGTSLVGFALTNGAAREGGGVWCESGNAMVFNCVLTGNSAFLGGGANGGTLYNCILNGNLTGVDGGGGGAFDCTLNNCTLSGNVAIAGYFGGGGAVRCTLNNCILYYNSLRNGQGSEEDNYRGGVLSYSCTTPLPSGIGNLTNAPLFLNQVGGNLRLQYNSPCINAGSNASAPASPDLDYNPRIAGGTVDIGAYEFQAPQSLISYAWLQQYGLPIDGSADVTDADGDGLNNWQEWRTGTNPTNALSVLRMFNPAPGAPGVIVSWQSASGLNYFLERGTGLGAQSPFLPLATGIVGQPGTTTFTDTNAVGAGPFFYRVGVQE
jgi:hypothetical protein